MLSSGLSILVQGCVPLLVLVLQGSSSLVVRTALVLACCCNAMPCAGRRCVMTRAAESTRRRRGWEGDVVQP
eukprot:5540455-Prymnesium_polylepis.1